MALEERAKGVDAHALAYLTKPSLPTAPAMPTHGELVLVDYGGERLSSGLGHAVYTRLDGMLSHATHRS